MLTTQDYADFEFIKKSLAKAKKNGCPPWVEKSNFARWLEALELMYKNMSEEFRRQDKSKLLNAITGAYHVPSGFTSLGR